MQIRGKERRMQTSSDRENKIEKASKDNRKKSHQHTSSS